MSIDFQTGNDSGRCDPYVESVPEQEYDEKYRTPYGKRFW